MSVIDVATELGRGNLRDPRLSKRAESMTRALVAMPGATLPMAMGSTAAREGAYRFLSNRRVSLDAVLAPHIEATVERARAAGKVYLVSDTTEFKFSTDRKGLGFLSSEHQHGFLGHFTLAVSADGRRTPLGVVGVETLTRSVRKGPRDQFARKKDADRESLRWHRCAERASQKVEGVSAVHVADAEADIYELMAALCADSRRFIIRIAQDRSVDQGRLFETLDAVPMHFTREVQLSARPGSIKPKSKRRHPPRSARTANLSVSSSRVSIKIPSSSCDPDLPDNLVLNVVRVWESAPPEGEEPVEWRLFTTEPVATQSQIEEIIDGYRTRWIIEEYFKALKTGCSYEQSQLESLHALENLLGIYAAVAWQLLLIRSVARDEPDRPASDVITPTQLTVLRLILRGKRLPPMPTVANIMTSIAELGAHIKSNGLPGWLVLGRGFEELRRAELLYNRMNSATS